MDQLRELARWLELCIPLLVKLSGFFSKLDGTTSPDDWEELYCHFLSEQEKMLSEFKFPDPPCENVDFAFQLIYIVNVSSEIGDRCRKFGKVCLQRCMSKT